MNLTSGRDDVGQLLVVEVDHLLDEHRDVARVDGKLLSEFLQADGHPRTDRLPALS